MSETLMVGILKALYKKGSLTELPRFAATRSFSLFEQETFKWYIDMFGREDFNHLYIEACKKAFAEKIPDIEKEKNRYVVNSQIKGGIRAKSKEIREFIQNMAHQIVLWDKSIIAYYHGYIKCDKIVDFNRGPEQYEKYCAYVRNYMPKKYRLLTDILIRLVYPKLLQRHHQTNPKLVEFTKSLPNPPKGYSGIF